MGALNTYYTLICEVHMRMTVAPEKINCCCITMKLLKKPQRQNMTKCLYTALCWKMESTVQELNVSTYYAMDKLVKHTVAVSCSVWTIIAECRTKLYLKMRVILNLIRNEFYHTLLFSSFIQCSSMATTMI